MNARNYLIKLIAWALQAQLLISPNYVLAQDSKKSETKTKDKKKFDFNKALEKANSAIDGFARNGGLNGIMGNGMPGMTSQGGPMPQFSPQATMTDDYFGKCRLLQETTNKADISICNINTPEQYQQYQLYQQQARFNANEYALFSKEGVIRNVNGMQTGDNAQGLKCIKSETESLQKFFQSRLDEIDDFLNMMKKESEIVSNTIERGYLKPLRDIQARLYGNNGDLQFDNKQFKNFFSTPACASLSDKDFEQLGGSQGLNGIRTSLIEDFETSSGQGPNSYSPKRFLQAKGEISRAIMNGAKRIARDVQNKIDTGAQMSSDELTNVKNSGFQVGAVGSLKEAVSDQIKIYSDLTKDIEALEVDASLKMNARDPNVNFEQKIQQYESRMYSQCLADAFNKQGMPLDTFLSRIRNANSLKGAKVQYQIDLQNLVNQLRAEDISYEEFSKRFDSLKPGTTYVLGQQGNANRVSAGLPMRNALTFCENQYSRVDEGQKYSVKQSIDILRKKHIAIKNKAKNLANDVQANIIDRVLNCAGMESTGVTANSCSASSFDSGSSNFCVAGATKCAANMNLCLNQAKNEITKVENARNELVNGSAANGRPGLKQVVANQKRSVEARYQQLEAKVRSMSDELKRRLPGINAFPVPEVFTHTEADKKFLLEGDPNLPESLRVEDPIAYMERLQEHLSGPNGLKASIEKQRDSVFNGDPSLSAPFSFGIVAYVNQIKKAYAEEAKAWQVEANKCQAQVAQFQEDQKKKTEEFNEALIACKQLEIAKSRPNIDLAEDAMKVLIKMGEIDAVYTLKEIKEYNDELEFNEKGQITTSIQELRAEVETLTNELEELKKRDPASDDDDDDDYLKQQRSIDKKREQINNIKQKIAVIKSYNSSPLVSNTGEAKTPCMAMVNDQNNDKANGAQGENSQDPLRNFINNL